MNRRAVLLGAACAGACATLRDEPDVVVSGTARAGGVATLAEAFALAERARGAPFHIRLEEGVYREKLTLTAPNVTISGESPDAIIAFDAAAGLTRPDGERWGTSGSATLTINSPGVALHSVTIRNSFDYLGRAGGDINGAQAVALAIGRAADRTTVTACVIEGYQDTLLVQTRAYFGDCKISGCVDFIFGGAAAYFARCEIVSRAVPGAPGGFIAAPSTHQAQPHGFVFSRCRLTREAGVPDRAIHLGRPWRAGGNMELLGAATVLNCWMDAHIAAEGWTSMGYRDPQGQARQLTPEEARFFEFGSEGPGAGAPSSRRRVLAPQEAALVTRDAVLGGWRPA